MLKIKRISSTLGGSKMIFILILNLYILGCYSAVQNTPINTVNENKSLINSQSELDEKQVNKFENSKSELERYRRLWKDKNITSYNFTSSIFYHRLYYPAAPVLIKVRAAKNISIEPISKSSSTGIEEYKRFDTVEKIFEAIELMLESKQKITIKYNKEIGYPEEIIVNEPPEGGVWFVMNIEKFEVIE